VGPQITACRLDECPGDPPSAAVPLTAVMTPLSFVGCRDEWRVALGSFG